MKHIQDTKERILQSEANNQENLERLLAGGIPLPFEYVLPHSTNAKIQARRMEREAQVSHS